MKRQDWDKPAKVAHLQEDAIRQELILMENDSGLDTRVSLVKEEGMSVRLITFQEKHLVYLREHPKVNPIPYLTNLKTMIKIRTEKWLFLAGPRLNSRGESIDLLLPGRISLRIVSVLAAVFSCRQFNFTVSNWDNLWSCDHKQLLTDWQSGYNRLEYLLLFLLLKGKVVAAVRDSESDLFQSGVKGKT